MAALVLLAAAALFLSLPAAAQTGEVKPKVRTFPQKALRGEMVVLSPQEISMNGKPDRLSVGARIHSIQNRLVRPSALVNQKLTVNYLRGNTGQVHQVWILNSEEALQKRAGDSATIFNFTTGSSAAPADSAQTPPGQ